MAGRAQLLISMQEIRAPFSVPSKRKPLRSLFSLPTAPLALGTRGVAVPLLACLALLTLLSLPALQRLVLPQDSSTNTWDTSNSSNSSHTNSIVSSNTNGADSSVRIGVHGNSSSGSLPSLSRCPSQCSEHGVCNEELGICHCLTNYAGPDCSQHALPSCQLLPGWTSPCYGLTTCECVLECQQYRLPVPFHCVRGTLPSGALNGNVSQVLDGPRYIVRWNLVATDVLPPNYALPPEEQTVGDAKDPRLCPDLCGGHGECDRAGSFCRCPWAAQGSTCSEAARVSMVMPEHVPACLNQCSGKGECAFGVCRCQPGFFGLDCSLFIDSAGHTSMLPQPPYAWASISPPSLSASVSPRIYVYDLPPYLNTWQGLHSPGLDWEEPFWLLERLLLSPHRTVLGEEADFFYVPLFIRGRIPNMANVVALALDYVRSTWPFYNRTGGHNHIVLTNSDWGNCQLGGPEGYGLMSPVLDDIMTLTLWGLSKNTSGGDYRPCFRPGRDIVLPPLMDPKVYFMAPDFPGSEIRTVQNRTILMYFRGSSYLADKQVPGKYRMSFGARQLLYKHFEGKFDETGIMIETMTKPGQTSYLHRMLESVFCFAPAGWGWAMRTTQSVIMGCIPVIAQPGVFQPFEGYGLDWGQISVRVELNEISQLHTILRGIPKERVEEMQKAMARERWRFVWSSPNLNPFSLFPSETFGDGAKAVAEKDMFVALLEALRARKMIQLKEA